MADFFFFNDTATTEIYTLSLHDALPISHCRSAQASGLRVGRRTSPRPTVADGRGHGTHERHPRTRDRSEEHTSELQSRQYLVCRLLLEKKKTRRTNFLWFCRTYPSRPSI